MTIKLAFDATATPLHLVGAGYYVKELVILLDKEKDIELNIITRKNDGDRFKSFAPNAKIHAIAPNNIALRIAFQTYKLGTYVDSLNVDVFHGPHYQLPIKMKTKSVVTIHDTTLLTHKNIHHMKKAIYFSKMIPFAVKNADAIITVSKSSADDIEKIFGVKENISVAHLGVDEDRFFPYQSKTDKQRNVDIDLLTKRGIVGEYIGFLGLLEPRKSVPTLISAFSKIADKFPKTKLVIAGSQAWGIEEIRESIRNCGFATRIILPGRLSDEEAGAFLRQSQVFVYPSLYEGFGLPVLEAMACGTPTITTNSSSLKEVAGSGISAGALMFKPLDNEKLSILLTNLLSDEKSLQDYSKKAITRATNFSWKKCVQEHIDTYKSVL
jgi:glycosyltransferase involved in cell wall biosynthesis